MSHEARACSRTHQGANAGRVPCFLLSRPKIASVLRTAMADSLRGLDKRERCRFPSPFAP
jgi:hypothetical protein